MASIPLPALAVRPPEQQPGVLDQYTKIIGLRGMQAQQHTQELQQQGLEQENQMRALQIKDQKIISDSYQKNKGDLDKTFDDAASKGVNPTTLIGLHTAILGQRTKEQELLKTGLENTQTQNDALLQAHDYVKSLPEAQRPAAYQAQLQNLAKVPGIDVTKLPPQYDPKTFDLIGAGLTGTAARLQALARMKQAEKLPEGEQPLGDKSSQLNDALTLRFQVLNPGKPLPPALALPPNATQKDFDRVDKILQQTENAAGTKAQQETANAMRAQTQEMMRQNQQDRIDKEGIQPVVGTDKNGQSVLVSAADAKSMGLTGTMKADADLVNKAQAARDWLKLADKQGDTPETMGIQQLVDKMDKEGKLGTIASRWNEFMAGKIGAGDPEFAALRAKMGLSTTKLMQAHVGSRGGAFLLEHFEDLANAKKMDAPTLKAGIGSELNYMQDVAKLPGSGGGNTGGLSFKAPNNKTYHFKDQQSLDNFKKEANIQ